MASEVKTSKVSYVVFVISLVIVLSNLVALVFPSLIVTYLVGSEIGANPFEAGTWAIPLITINLVLLVFAIFYYKNLLPKFIRNGYNFLLNFEVSRNVAFVVVVGVMFFYIGYSVPDLFDAEEELWADFMRVELAVDNWPFGDPKEVDQTLHILYVKNFFLKSSQILFDNFKVIPFIASASILLLTYFFTVEITKKRFAGIVAMGILFQSRTFLEFDTLAVYSNFWTLFYLLSLYLIYKKWYLSPLSFIASIFSKPLSAAYLPMTLFFIFRAEISRRKKFYILISYAIIVVIAIAGIFILDIDLGGGVTSGKISFDYIEFWSSLTIWGFQLRADTLFLLFVLPVTVGLFLKSRKGILQADSIQILITGTIFVMPLLAALTLTNLHPYRFVPLVVFFAIGVGTLLAQKIKQ